MGKDNKRIGNTAELEVSAKLSALGYEVSFPFGESAYDLIANKGKKLIRIQVKSATLSDKGSYRCALTHGSSSQNRYTRDDCDAIILYAPYSKDYNDMCIDGFYIIPIKEVVKSGAQHAFLFPEGKGKGNYKTCKWEKFRNAWGKL